MGVVPVVRLKNLQKALDEGKPRSFTMVLMGAAAQPTAFLAASGALTARKLKVATAPGVRMTQADLYRLYGESYGGYQHFVLRELDLSEAELQSDGDLVGLAWLTSMKKVTYPATTSSIPTTFSDGSRCQIEEVVIPDNAAIGLTVAQQAFHNKSLKKVVFGTRSSIHIGNLCFQGNPNLTTVDFHYGSTSIVSAPKPLTAARV